MFYSITGKVVYSGESCVAVSCGGVAFLCQTSSGTLRQIGSAGGEITLFTYLNVREDALDLFGFADKEELDVFRLLIGVTGVGPKAALAILSAMTPQALAVCVASEDSKSITRAQGVGPKLAQRVVLELKDKIAAGLPSASSGVVSAAAAGTTSSGSEAVEALLMLGYSRSEASVAVGRLDDGLSTEEIIRQALRYLSNN